MPSVASARSTSSRRQGSKSRRGTDRRTYAGCASGTHNGSWRIPETSAQSRCCLAGARHAVEYDDGMADTVPAHWLGQTGVQGARRNSECGQPLGVRPPPYRYERHTTDRHSHPAPAPRCGIPCRQLSGILWSWPATCHPASWGGPNRLGGYLAVAIQVALMLHESLRDVQQITGGHVMTQQSCGESARLAPIRAWWACRCGSRKSSRGQQPIWLDSSMAHSERLDDRRLCRTVPETIVCLFFRHRTAHRSVSESHKPSVVSNPSIPCG
jgi:hypothetical protein